MMKFSLIILIAITIVQAQENAQSRIPQGLLDCYREEYLFNRENRLPMTINTLIEIIKKVEDDPDSNLSIQDLAVGLIHRFRQDGIERINGVQASPGVVPYKASGFQFTKHRILLQKLLPTNAQAQRFPNETLTIEETCTLHFMLSSSIDKEVRGDEPTKCSQLAQYRDYNRVPRDVKDVEMINDVKHPKNLKASKLKAADDEDDYDLDEQAVEPRTIDFGVDLSNTQISQCPLENGVVRTKWGTISAGTLLAGIATGLMPQTVRLLDIMPKKAKGGEQRARQSQQIYVDNRWAATLAGDLSETALSQGPRREIQVGANGAWNSIVIPRSYYLSERERFEMTDAEIRGGLDGLIIASKINEWRNNANNLKLYQVIDMYYSQRGVFNGEEKACNRKNLFNTVAPVDVMKQQTSAFSYLLDADFTNFATLDNVSITRFSSQASDSLVRYVPQSLNDLSCEATARSSNDPSLLRTLTDLFIFVDTQWTFNEIHPVVSDIIEHSEMGFQTNITILSAFNAELIVNSTAERIKIFSTWNETVHQKHPGGLNLPKVIEKMKQLSENLLNSETSTPYVAGKSKIALIIPKTAGVSETERNHALDRISELREVAPDLRILFLAGGTSTRFADYVKDKDRDHFPLNAGMTGPGNEIHAQTIKVIERIQTEPRRVVNHKCGGKWNNNQKSSHESLQFIEPNGLLYYRLHPNYFYRQQDNRKIKIQGLGSGSLSVCHSRKVEFPRQNGTDKDQTCRKINSDTVEIGMANACDGKDYISQCNPLYISVEYPLTTPTSNYMCSDLGCRSPDSARFKITAENLGCYSSATQVFSSILLILVSIYTTVRMFN